MKYIVACLFMIHFCCLCAQESQPAWIQKMYSTTPDIGEVSELYDAYYSSHPFVKNEHTQHYKRWIRKISRDITGESNPRLTDEERKRIRQHHLSTHHIPNQARNSGNSWTGIGPYNWDHDAASRSYAPGAAHVYTVEQAPSNSDILYAGTATAGVWKSIDHGENWDCMSCDIPDNRCYAVDIHPTDANIVLADMLDNIYISTNGGVSWQPTGDANFQNLNMDVYDILFHATNGNIAFAATSLGLYRTDDQGGTWTQVISNKTQEIEAHPTNNSIYYAVEQSGDRTRFYRSTDTGNSFVHQSNGWPTPSTPDHNRRAEIAVSPDEPNKVVALLTGSVNGGSGLYGIYISSDQGSTWTFNCCGPQPGGLPDLTTTPPNINTMAWADDGSDNGGQYYYDAGLAVSPTDADSIFIAGVNLWVSGDGGTTFTCPAKWSHSYKPNYVHADIHDVHYYSNGELWIGCDGGIFHSDNNGQDFHRKMRGIHGSDFWGYGASFWSGEVMLGGAYHNGTLIKNDTAYIDGWHCIDGGDGTGGFVNVGREKRVYTHFNIKDLPNDRLTEIPTRGYAVKPYSHYIIGRSSNLVFHPTNYSKQFFGKDDCLYTSDNDNVTAEIVHCFGEAVADVEISLVNPDYIYVATFPSHWDEKHIYRTTNGGMSWTDITPSTSVFSSNRWLPYDIALSDTDPETLYIARVSNSVASYNGQKIYKSTNGGANWTNLTTAALDNEQLTNIIYQRGSAEGLYIGSRRSVFYNSNNQTDWMECNTDLPASTLSTKLLINYRTQKIRNATNRSVYEMDLIEPSSPQALISVDKQLTGCELDTFYFSDYSVLSDENVSRVWSFPGALYVDSNTGRTPKVVYGQAGIYAVSLAISDDFGSSSTTITDYITVESGCTVDTIPGSALTLSALDDYATVPLSGTISSFTITAWIKPDGIQPEYAGIFIADGSVAGLNFKTNNRLGYHWPGGQWWWTSNHTVPTDEWSHVALVAEPEGVRIYLNGIPDEHTISLSPATFIAGFIGSYNGWQSRNYKGEIDELTLWNRALTTEEIRESMHLTKEETIQGNDVDTSLLAYYQFNEQDGIIAYDPAGLRHATLLSNASRSSSAAPVGGGTASTHMVDMVGSYAYIDEQVQLDFADANRLPNGPVVVSRINLAPHGSPSYIMPIPRYYVMHAFGDNSSYSMQKLSIGEYAGTGLGCDDHFIFQRGFNDTDDTWQGPIAPAEWCTSDTLHFLMDSLDNRHQFAVGGYSGNYYVDERAPSGGDGRYWETAFDELATGIHLAGAMDTVFVAKGNYAPMKYPRHCDICDNDRQKTFHPRNGVVVLGGFPSSGGSLLQRDWVANPTVVSGDVSNALTDRAYHILTIDSLSTSMRWDGFQFRDGLANGSLIHEKSGAAILCAGYLKLVNAQISANEADHSIIQVLGPFGNLEAEATNATGNTTLGRILDVNINSKSTLMPDVHIDN